MKKALLTLAIVAMTLVASAQRGSDNFFSMSEMSDNRLDGPGIGMPQSNIGSTTNESAPLGTGLLIMTALGAGYAFTKKNR